jgi:ATP-binding cassette, subfamily B (MDR/TAP), member 8
LFVFVLFLSSPGRKDVNDEGKDTKFDWKRFWSYLRPHILKLLASICAALAVAFFNIKIPNMLGELVNTLSKFIGSGEAVQQAETSFVRSMSGPAFKLFSLYAAQVSI